MSLQLAIAINVVSDLGLLGGLAYAMSRTAKLTPHFRAPRRATARHARATRLQTRSPFPTSTAS
jgi:hypothetical protein